MEEFFDAVILAVKKTDDWVKEGLPRTFLLGCYDPEKGFVKIGDASSGLKLHEKAAIGETVEYLQLNEDKNYVYLQPLIVVEASYFQKRKKGLRFPKLIRIRFDKDPKECLLPNFSG